MLKLNIKKYFKFIIVIALLIFLHFLKITAPVESFLASVLSPVFKTFYSLSSGIKNAYKNQTENKSLADELKTAREIINRLTAEKIDAKFLEEENSRLRRQLNFLNKNNKNYLMANIVSLTDPGVKENRSAVINKGLKDGLFPGLAVVSSLDNATSTEGVIVGKIINVKENLSEICLITDKNCKLAASILGEAKTSGIARGELGLTVKMDFIPQTENIKIDDLVATSGLEQSIPRGLVIGKVTKIVKENNEVWQSATIEPQINLDALSIVAVLLP